MAGLFGALFLLACGGAHAYKDIAEARDNEKSREEARRDGRKYYFALDGERTVDTNHKILRLPDGIKDMQTGEWLFDKRKQDTLERKQLSELDEISKKEAIIKGQNTYWCTLHESDPRRYGIRMNGKKRYQRLVCNDMPIDRVLRESFDYYREKDQVKISKRYEQATELQFRFILPLNVELEIEQKVFEKCKDWNMNFIMNNICQIYPINEVKIVFNYCKKYNIPMGTWNEIEAMMLKEHPLGWRKVPASENWKFEKFVNGIVGL